MSTFTSRRANKKRNKHRRIEKNKVLYRPNEPELTKGERKKKRLANA